MNGLWQVDRTPRVGALRAAGAHLSGLPAAALAVRVDPSVDTKDPLALLRRCVGLRLVWHPSLAALLDGGASATSATTYTCPAGAPVITALVAATRPGVWASPTGGGSDLDKLADILGCSIPGPDGHGPELTRIVATRRGRVVTLRLDVHTPVTVPSPSGPLTLSVNTSTRLTPTAVPAAVHAAAKAGHVVVDADLPGRLGDLGWLVDRRLLVTPAPGAPGWARIDTGPLVTSSLAPVLPATDAVTGARPARGQVAVAVDDLVSAAAAYATAAPARDVPVPGVVLRSWQEQFIGQYLSAGYGLLNSLPPGSGKTACVAGAFATAAANLERPHRAVVVAPATLLGQWSSELAVFHPNARVQVLTTEDDLRAPTTSKAPQVFVTSPALLAKHPHWFTALRPDDLAVDEGTWLRGESTQTKAAWAVRRVSTRAVVLTGTADNGPGGTLEAIIAFVTGRPGIMAGPVEPSLCALSAAERAGAFAFGGGRDVLAALPGATPTPTLLANDLAAGVVQRHGVALVRDVLARAGTGPALRRAATRLRTQLDGWRTGLACPAALVAGTSVLGRSVRGELAATVTGTTALEYARAVPALVGSKVSWVRQWVADGVAHDAQSLVFADSLGALDVLADQINAHHEHVRVAVVSSKVRPPARARAVAAFTGGDLDVLLVASAGQLGLNLQSASRVAHLDVPASAGTLLQRSARAARMGSMHENIEVAVPVLRGTAEQIWWSHTGGASAAVDVLGLARELVAP